MDIRSRELNGYRLLHLPEHYEALENKTMGGWVYEHRVIAMEMIGRPLRPDEEVHHLDEDRSNNHPENLLVLTKSQHMKLHGWLRRIGVDPKDYPTKICKQCKTPLSTEQEHYCSPECRILGARTVDRPTKEVLEAEVLLMPMTKIGKKYGVSDNAVRKWCRAYDIDIPARYAIYRNSVGEGTEIQVQ